MSRTSTGLALAALLASAACGHEREDALMAAASAEEAILVRQIHGLETLVAAGEGGTLVSDDQLAVAVDEQVVEGLIRAALPFERELLDRFRIRLETVEVEFRASRSAIELRGRVSPRGVARTFADVRLVASIQRASVDPASGRLKIDLALDEFEVMRATAVGTETRAGQALAAELGRQRMDTFAALVPQLEIPVRLDQRLRMEGFTEGPASVDGGELQIKLEVARLIPLAGRLWIVLDVSAGSWQRVASSEAGGK